MWEQLDQDRIAEWCSRIRPRMEICKDQKKIQQQVQSLESYSADSMQWEKTKSDSIRDYTGLMIIGGLIGV